MIQRNHRFCCFDKSNYSQEKLIILFNCESQFCCNFVRNRGKQIQFAVFKKKERSTWNISMRFQRKYESLKVIRNTSDSITPILFYGMCGGYPNCKMNVINEQRQQAWILPLTSTFVRCLTYIHVAMTFYLRVKRVHTANIVMNYI